MELRGLILLTALACSVRATTDMFTDCKKFPASITKPPDAADATTKVEAVPADGGAFTVTLHGDLKQFVITAWESANLGTTMAKGEFDVVTKDAAEEMKCDGMDKSAVKNKTPMPTAKPSNVVVTWKPKAEYKGKVKFMALVISETKHYNVTSSEAEIKMGNAAGPTKEEPKKESTTGAASYTGLSTWLLIVALGLVAVGGHQLHRPMN